jgi:hypothetical protein
MQKLIDQTLFDPEILKLMSEMNPFETKFTSTFLNYSMDLINQSKKIKPYITITKKISKNIATNKNQKMYIYDTAKFIFNNHLKYISNMTNYLSIDQINIMIDLFSQNKVKSLDDFNYMIGHLPFYTELVGLIIDLAKKNKIPSLPEPFPEITLNTFISPIIQSWIFENCRHFISIDFMVDCENIKNMAINLKLISPYFLNQSDCDRIIQLIAKVSCSLLNSYKIKNPKPLNLIYIMTPFKKKLNYFTKNNRLDKFLIEKLKNIKNLRYNFDRFNNPVSSINVNSGVTVTQYESSKDFISIWRCSEFTKVLIHELIHYYDLEKGERFNLLSIGHLNISNNYQNHSKELFTELQTWYFFTIFNLSQSNYEYSVSDINFIFDYERLYSLVNVYRIFNHYNINSIKQLFSNNDKLMINISSSILYYYIFKALLLCNIDSFIEWLIIPGQSVLSESIMTDQIEKKIVSVLYSPKCRQIIDFILLSKPQLTDSLNMMGMPDLTIKFDHTEPKSN